MGSVLLNINPNAQVYEIITNVLYSMEAPMQLGRRRGQSYRRPIVALVQQRCHVLLPRNIAINTNFTFLPVHIHTICFQAKVHLSFVFLVGPLGRGCVQVVYLFGWWHQLMTTPVTSPLVAIKTRHTGDFLSGRKAIILWSRYTAGWGVGSARVFSSEDDQLHLPTNALGKGCYLLRPSLMRHRQL